MQLAKAIEAANAAYAAAATEVRDDAQILHEDGRFPQRAYLISMGIPFDAAMSLSEAELIAWTVAFGEVEGGEWDWQAGAWKSPERKLRMRPGALEA